MVIVIPVVLVAVMLVVQFALGYHARQVLAGAAHDGAAAGARPTASPADGAALAGELIEGSAGQLLDTYTVTASVSGDVVTVTATGRVVSLLPFFGSMSVAASGSARLERFDPQGGP